VTLSRTLLDLFCGAGGAAMGYHRAGFEVIGVDIRPQPHFPFRFVEMDVLKINPDYLPGIEAIHASPPCQAHTAGRNIWKSRLDPDRHDDLVGETRELLKASGLPYVIENVVGAPLIEPWLLCGQALGLGVKRHRLFETTFPLMVPPCPEGHPGDWISVFGGGALSRTPPGGQGRVDGKHNGKGAYDGRTHIPHVDAAQAMEIDWMTRDELSNAIPPAYTELIGHQLMQHLSFVRG
jgi:DNA (cytosine-5)-methyltransferase 1